MVIKFIRTGVFKISMIKNKNHCLATVVDCNGSLRKTIKFKEFREYAFVLDYSITKGALVIEVHDPKSELVLRLDSTTQNGSILANSEEAYHVAFKFKDAEGSCDLKWE